MDTTTTPPANGWHWREWAAELAGTALLLFAVVTAKDWIVRAGPPLSETWIRVALVGAVAGLAVIAVAYSPLGRRSGAHLNPALTLGLALRRAVGAADLVAYPVAQLAGATAGAAAARVWGPGVAGTAVRWAVIAPAPWLGSTAAVVIEAAGTAVLLSAVFACLASPRRAPLAPLAAGGLLAVAVAGLAPVSGAGFNPVRGLGPDLVGGVFPQWWVYLAGPLAGAVAAAAAAGGRRAQAVTGKLVHDPAVPCYLRCALAHPAPPGPEPGTRPSRNVPTAERNDR